MKLFDVTNDKYHMGHLIYDALRSRPDAICQIDAATGESETNALVLRRSVQFARCLLRFGIRPGDVLALGGSNHLDLHIPYYAAVMIGMPTAGVDPHFKYTEIKTLFKICSPKIAFCQKDSIDDTLQAIKDLNLDTKLICFDDGEYSMKRFIQEYDDNIDDTEFEPLDFDLDRIYAWFVGTGGTTGTIKLAAIKHRSFFKKLSDLKAVFKSFPNNGPQKNENRENKPTLCLSPVQWISALFGALSYPSMRLTKIMSSDPATPDHVIDIINKYKPVTAMLGPSLVAGIIKSDKECDFSCFSHITLLGSKVHKDLFLELKKKLRPEAALFDLYGQTENIGPVLIPSPLGPIGNCGKIPVEWQEKIKFIDPETGIEIKKPNVPGEMWTKLNTFSEYYNNPIETANAFTDDGWYKTGDLLYTDEDNNCYFVERLKLMIKYRNYHVIPLEIEAVILKHPGVYDVTVTSIPHEDDGEHPVACVVRRHGTNVTAEEIKDCVANHLSDSQKLRGGVVFLDKIPYTSTGKVARSTLKQIMLTAQRE